MIVQFSTKNDPTNHIEVEVSVFSVDSTKTRLYLKSEFLQIQEGVFVQFDDGVAGLELIILNENLESFHVDGVVGHEALAAGFVARGVNELDGDRPHRHGVADAVDGQLEEFCSPDELPEAEWRYERPRVPDSGSTLKQVTEVQS